MNGFLEKLKYFLDKIKKSKRSPEQAAGDLMRELNSRIPRMVEGLSVLKSEKDRLLNDSEVLYRKADMFSKKYSAAARSDNSKLTKSIGSEKKSIDEALENINAEYGKVEILYRTAVREFNRFIADMESSLSSAAEKVKSLENRKKVAECRLILEEIRSEASHQLNGNDENRGKPSGNYTSSISEGFEKVSIIKKLAEEADGNTAVNIKKAAELSAEILTAIREKRDKSHAARMFLFYYLDAIIRITEGYLRLTGARTGRRGKPETILRIEKLIGSVADTFQSLLNGLHEKEMTALEAELTTMENILGEDRKPG